ncbi:MAG: hypothetical protein SVM86_00290, partial [Candidatus Cloacimonadota bacterium]|nr:hypothetical protein [Candidatus Cloacimonadota bacterium]
MEKIAVIDVGTNNVLLLIARKNGDSVQVLKRKSAISALGRNMKNNKITLSALKRLKKILYEYIEYSKLFTSKIIVVGTSCAREAQNSNVIKEWLKKTHSIYFKIISGEEEAYLNGVANLTDFPNKKMVFFDVGGGSTEFTYVDNGKICRVFSLKLGIRRLHNDFSDLSNRLKFTKKNLQKLPKQNT